MYCPYEENLACPYVDTAVMDKTTTCQECEHYHKPTEEEEIEDWNNFMMRL